MPRGKHLWDATGLVSLPLIALAFVYFNFLEEYVAARLPASVSERWERYPSLRIGKDQTLFVITPSVQLVLGLAAGGVAWGVYRVARFLEGRNDRAAERERPSSPRRGATRAPDLPEERSPPFPEMPLSAPLAQVASDPSAAGHCGPAMARRVAELLASLPGRGKQLAADMWSAEIGRFRGYPLRFVVRADDEYLFLQVQSPLVPEQRWDPNVLAGALLDAHAWMHYGSFRFVENGTGQLVALGQVCDTRYVPPQLLREIAWRLAEQYRDMICKLYALDLIEDGWCDGEWGTPC